MGREMGSRLYISDHKWTFVNNMKELCLIFLLSVLFQCECYKIDWAKINSCLPYEKTDEQKALRRKMFAEIDKRPNGMKGNGLLSLAELEKGIKDVLKCDEELIEAKPAIARAFEIAKSKSKSTKSIYNDYVTFSEFRFFLETLRQYFGYWFVFHGIDENDDRKIDLDEFKDAAEFIEINTKSKIDDAEKTFKEIDKSDGGHILFEEFIEWCKKFSEFGH